MNRKMVVNVRTAVFDVLIDRTTKWGNPWTHVRTNLTRATQIAASRDEAIAKYEEWIKTQPKLMAALPELKGKVLGCHCVPLRCHGEVLLKLIDELCVDCNKKLRIKDRGDGVRCMDCLVQAATPDNEDG